MMTWGNIRMSLDDYQNEMRRLEKMHARRAQQGLPVRPKAPRWPGRVAGMSSKWLTSRLRAISKRERENVFTAPPDPIRQG